MSCFMIGEFVSMSQFFPWIPMHSKYFPSFCSTSLYIYKICIVLYGKKKIMQEAVNTEGKLKEKKRKWMDGYWIT